MQSTRVSISTALSLDLMTLCVGNPGLVAEMASSIYLLYISLIDYRFKPIHCRRREAVVSAHCDPDGWWSWRTRVKQLKSNRQVLTFLRGPWHQLTSFSNSKSDVGFKSRHSMCTITFTPIDSQRWGTNCGETPPPLDEHETRG